MPKLRSSLVLVALTATILSPLSSRADTRAPHTDVTIDWDGELDAAHGVRSGNGTTAHPYVISGWTIGNISIRDTDKAIRIVGNTITGTLTLNWIGPAVEVTGNSIGDLRVNQNIPRWGDPTAGRIERNTFTTVGQLRHYDGSFRYNTVGAANGSEYPDTRAVNFDGFNGTKFQYNTIYGYVDARLHGHHHSSAYGMPSHMHVGGPGMEEMDHTQRYDEVTIDHNAIYTSADYALAYLDTDHAANDRTANSETNPYLNAPHVHHTRVHILSNKLVGAGLLIDVFNAADERHKGYATGVIDIASNRITLQRDMTHRNRALYGIKLLAIQFANASIAGNVIEGPGPIADVPMVPSALLDVLRLDSGTAGIVLATVDRAAVTISKDTVTNRQFGVQAMQMSSSVRWTITGLVTNGVKQNVSYDSTVKNPPAMR